MFVFSCLFLLTLLLCARLVFVFFCVRLASLRARLTSLLLGLLTQFFPCCTFAIRSFSQVSATPASNPVIVYSLPVVAVNRLAGLVIKASASGAEDPGFQSRLRRDFSGSSHTSDLKIGFPVATLPGIIWSALGLVGPVPVCCDWVR